MPVNNTMNCFNMFHRPSSIIYHPSSFSKSFLFSLCSLFFLLCNLNSFAQQDSTLKETKKKKGFGSMFKTESADEYVQDTPYKNENFTYVPYIKTVQLTNAGFEMGEAAMNLDDSNEKLVLSFDDIEAGFKNFSYTIIHCNSNWEPSNLFVSDYLQGFNEVNINKYSYSISTLTKYTHYESTFPNNDFRIIKSGNYILKVYKDFDPNQVVITRRFIVYSDKMIIVPDYHRPSIVNDRNYKQELDFKVIYQNLKINDLFSDVKVVVLQNNRWDNCKTGLQPAFIKDNELTYDYDDKTVFNGNNEFRYFDTRNLQLKNNRVVKIAYKDSINHVYLNDDIKRAFKRYSIEFDINGKYFIKNQNGFTGNTDADYVMTHFYLKNDLIKDGDVNLFGSLTDWNFDKKYKMKYNEITESYELDLLLKQGYYNYVYTTLTDGNNQGDDSVIEGSFFETENEYLILVYVRLMGTNYDQLLGYKRFNTNKM